MGAGRVHVTRKVQRLNLPIVRTQQRTRIKLLALVFLASVLCATDAEAQRTCRRGIPCGNTCIAADKVCRIGTSAPPRKPPSTMSSLIGANVDSSSFDWVGSVDGSVYYRKSCAVAAKLVADERLYFRTEEDALRLNYRRSKARGC